MNKKEIFTFMFLGFAACIIFICGFATISPSAFRKFFEVEVENKLEAVCAGSSVIVRMKE